MLPPLARAPSASLVSLSRTHSSCELSPDEGRWAAPEAIAVSSTAATAPRVHRVESTTRGPPPPPGSTGAGGSRGSQQRAPSQTFSRGFSPGPSSRASSRPPRAPSPIPVSSRGGPGHLQQQQLQEQHLQLQDGGASFWSSAVLVRVDVDHKGQGTWQRTGFRDLLTPVWSCLIKSYTEFRHAFRTTRLVPLPPPLGMHHSFIILELDRPAGGGEFEICLERFDNRLELMLGERVVMRSLAMRHKATGEPRALDSEKQVEETPCVLLGAFAGLPGVQVSDLFSWISGPLATAWQPYDLARLHCQHFTVDLIRFLRCEEFQIKIHALHPRPPPGVRLE